MFVIGFLVKSVETKEIITETMNSPFATKKLVYFDYKFHLNVLQQSCKQTIFFLIVLTINNSMNEIAMIFFVVFLQNTK